MERLSPHLIETIRSHLKGNRLKKFDASIQILNDSLAQGAWVSRGSVKANSGFYQGICSSFIDFKKDYSVDGRKAEIQDAAWQLHMMLRFGGLSRYGKLSHIDAAIRLLREQNDRLPEDHIIKAWVGLCEEKAEAYSLLTRARPKPVITPIGLSPKVTKTLTECNLDLDLCSIRMADLEQKTRQAVTYNEETHTIDPVFDRHGKPVMEDYWVVKWTLGILHHQSRFANGGCEACGKNIPSRKFVPIEAKDKRSGKLISMWLGCDCAHNIFGIKDVGVEKNVK